MILLRTSNLRKVYGDEVVFDSVSFDLVKGECLAVVGRSGRGKSTLLSILSGHESNFEGDVISDIKMQPSLEKAYIYQGIEQLFPWMTVLENIQFPMTKKGMSKDLVDETTEILLKETELYEHRNKYPKALSGGMKQRAVLARAIGYGPKIILLDEPFSHLDDIIREKLQDLLLSLKMRHQLTLVFVTHDLHEAIKVSDRILLMGKTVESIESVLADQKRQEYWQLYKKLTVSMGRENL